MILRYGSGRAASRAAPLALLALLLLSATSLLMVAPKAVAFSNTQQPIISKNDPNGGPQGVAFDSSGDFWVSDMGGYIYKFVPPVTSSSTAALTFSNASTDLNSIAFDPSGNLWAADRGNGYVYKFTAPFGSWSPAVTLRGPFSSAFGVAFNSSGYLFVADWSSGYVYGYKPPITSTSSPVVKLGVTGEPDGVAFDSSGNLWVASDWSTGYVTEYRAPVTSASPAALTLGSTNGVSKATGVTVDSAGDVWVSESTNDKVLEFTSLTGTPSPAVTLSTSNQLYGPVNTAFDSYGNLWVATNGGYSYEFAGPTPTTPYVDCKGGCPAKSVSSATSVSATLVTTGSSDVVYVVVSEASSTDTFATPTATSLTFSARCAESGNGVVTESYFATGAAAKSYTITETVSGSAVKLGMTALGVAGTSGPFDPNLHNCPTPTTGAGTSPSGSVTTTGTSDLVIGVAGVTNTGSTTPTVGAGSGFSTTDASTDPVYFAIGGEYKSLTSPATTTVPFTLTGQSGWSMIEDAFVTSGGTVPDLPYGAIPLLLMVPALYYLLTRRGQSTGRLNRA